MVCILVEKTDACLKDCQTASTNVMFYDVDVHLGAFESILMSIGTRFSSSIMFLRFSWEQLG